MRFFSFASLALLLAPALAAPTALKTVEKAAGDKKEGSYIVTLAAGVSKSSHLDALRKKLGADDSITHTEWDSHVLNGFAATLSPAIVDFLRAHPEVARIEEDGIVHTFATVTQVSVSGALPFGHSKALRADRLFTHRRTRRGAFSASAKPRN